ncbi:hypothetical protein, partial [Escherichia coli]|uniref:hypothetical protein n=1 Tax=Escherichia coli TaxID=562 RepID=UPI0019CF827D
WEGWVISLRQKQKKLIMLPSETMIWQPEFTDKTLSRKTGAVQYASPCYSKYGKLTPDLSAQHDAIPEHHGERCCQESDENQQTTGTPTTPCDNSTPWLSVTTYKKNTHPSDYPRGCQHREFSYLFTFKYIRSTTRLTSGTHVMERRDNGCPAAPVHPGAACLLPDNLLAF